MTKLKGWKAVARDVIMIWLLTGLGGFVIGVATAGSEIPMEAIGLSNILFGIIAFCIAGCMTSEHRWKHLNIVALFTWITSIINTLFIQISLASWVASIFVIFLMMGIGGGLSFLIVKPVSES